MGRYKTSNCLLALWACCAAVQTHAAAEQQGVPRLQGGHVAAAAGSEGLRPAIMEYILANFATSPAKMAAAMKFAQANELVLRLIEESKPITQSEVTKIADAGLCFAQNFDRKGFVKHVRELNARSFDSEARARAHDDFQRKAFGMSIAPSIEADACGAAK